MDSHKDFEAALKKYENFGFFSCKTDELWSRGCNAPDDKSGIYLIYKVLNDQEVLIYIGASGQRNLDGTIKTRKGGMKDRLINGYHPNRFDQPKRIKRSKALPDQMKVENISEIRAYWWITYDDNFQDLPTDVEAKLRELYLSKYNKLPDWHQNKLRLRT